MKEKQDDDRENTRKIIIFTITIIIVVLSLITSCSLTSTSFGRIGNEFGNEGEFSLKNRDFRTIRNYQLRFDKSYLKISASDAKYKLHFIQDKIKGEKFTCTTSDASIATCYVANDYVVINPKKTGVVSILLETTINHTIYQATARVIIGEATKYIKLSSKSGVINLRETNKLVVGYSLVGLSGDLVAVSSNERVAKVFVKNGYLYIVAYKTGKVQIKVSIVYNGITYEEVYDLTVINKGKKKSSDNYLTDIKVSTGKLEPDFDKNNNYYRVLVDANTDKITIKGIASSDKATIFYNGKRVTSLKNLPLKYGDNTVVIKVVAEDGSSRDYVVNVYREPLKDGNSYLKDIIVSYKNKELELSPVFDKNTYKYTVNVSNDTDVVSLKGIPSSSKATITYNGKKVSSLKNLSLKYGDNTVVIKVVAEDGTSLDYVVNIHREDKYEIKFEKKSYQFDVYTENLDYALLYKVYKNGVLLTDYDKELIKVKLDADLADIAEYELDSSVIVLKPDVSKLGDDSKDFKVGLEYMGSVCETTVSFKKEPVYLAALNTDIKVDVYKDDNQKLTGSTDVILATNLFTSFVVSNVAEDKKSVTVCSKKYPDTCVKVSTDSPLIDLDYTNNEVGVMYLPITVTGNGEGTATLRVTGTVGGKEFENFDVRIELVRKYLIKIDANGGEFEFGDTLITSKIGKDQSLDLTDFGEPYKTDANDSCKVYKFIGYSKMKDGEIIYNLSDKKIVDKLDDDLTLYARYETESSSLAHEGVKRTLWLVANGEDKDLALPIFHNEKYFKLHKEDKVIYPGASGYYVMNFTNDTNNRIVLKGLRMFEDTICISGDGCLNMGYIIKWEPAEISKSTVYYYGKQEDYKILNKDIDPRSVNYLGKQINFKDKNAEITLMPKESAAISILWKWVEIDDESDKLDTKIGNQAAESEFLETLNDKYKLSVGLDMEIYNDKCK